MIFPPRTLASILILVIAGGCSGLSFNGSSDRAVPAEEVTYHWAEERWTPAYRTEWRYGRSGGEATRVVHQSRDADEWVDVTKEEWTLDEEGRQQRATAYTWSDEGWTESGRMSYRYDEAGNKVTAIRRVVGENGSLLPSDSLASTFEGDLETERRFFRWVDGEWTEVLRQTSSFDDEGLETERLHLAPDGKEWTGQRRWSFTYGPDGQVEASTVEQMTEASWTPWLNQTYSHDAGGNVTAVVHEEWSEEGWTNMMRNETRYRSRR